MAEEQATSFVDDGDAVLTPAEDNKPAFLGTEIADPQLEAELQGELKAEQEQWQEVEFEGDTLEFPADMTFEEIGEIIKNEVAPIYEQGKEAIESWYGGIKDRAQARSVKMEHSKAMVDEVLLDALKEYEGYKGHGYYATPAEKKEGLVTVGYGSTKRVKHGEKITKEQAEEFLMEDASTAATFVEDELGNLGLDKWQKAAISSLVFNVGVSAFKKSKAYKALKKGDVDTFLTEAFDEDKGFVFQGKKKLKGLQNRRAKERDLFHTSENQRKKDVEDAITKLSPGTYMVDGELIEVS